MKKMLKKWWQGLLYAPTDPRCLAGGRIKIAVLGGGTGLSVLLRGLKAYSSDISAIVSVADNGASSGILKKEFDMVPPGDIRKCISALAYDEELISDLLEYRFDKKGNGLCGHTLGNIWLSGLTNYFNSFEKALETTTEIFKTAGRVLPATLDKIDLVVEYEDGDVLEGESHLDEVLKKIKNVKLNKKQVKAYDKAVEAIKEADLILFGPGSLYGSIIPNLLISGIKNAVLENTKAVKVYIANCSTERTQTRHYTIDDHIKVLFEHAGKKFFDYCLVNDNIIKRSEDEKKMGEINNISTDLENILDVRIKKFDVINESKPLYHDSSKLSKSIVELYREVKEKRKQVPDITGNL